MASAITSLSRRSRVAVVDVVAQERVVKLSAGLLCLCGLLMLRASGMAHRCEVLGTRSPLSPPCSLAGLDAENSEQSISAGAGLETEDAEELHLESSPGSREGWRRHVAPTEGYSVETPGEWVVVTDGVQGDGEVLEMSGPTGWKLGISRVAGRPSLLQLGHVGLDEPGEGPDGIGDLSVSVEPTAVGETMRLVYDEVMTSRSVTEYMVVRALLVKECSVTS